jgi:hypothetical protein
MVRVLNHLAAKAAVDIHSGTNLVSMFSRSVSMAHTRAGACGMWRSKITS